ncbi:MAG: DNA-processing protein DprA [Planctomycetaceae bacterium]
MEPLESDQALAEHLLLTQLPGVGPLTLARLLSAFETPAGVLGASADLLRAVDGVGPKLAQTIRHAVDYVDVAGIMQWCASRGVAILCSDDERYPSPLGGIVDAPPVLFVQGEWLPCDELSVAIVGTRHASVYGRQQAQRIAYGLAKAGVTIVSGMARGIDTAAHQGALDAGGRTIAVFGCGLGHIYPPENEDLANSIARSGALVSEFAPDTKPRGGMFPQRNRIISGLTHATLVIEAPERSGALITARTASEQGRDVLALPGNVNSRASQGTNLLIRDGAKLIRHAEDVLECLGPLARSVPTADGREVRRPSEALLNDQERLVLDCIQCEPTSIDRVVASSQLATQHVLATISVLEMRKLIRRLSNQYVSRI